MDLDEVLSELGHFGKFQAFNYVLLSVAILFTGLFEAGFIFTAGDLEYRCYIPECDESETNYQPIWLRRAVPFQHGVPSRCHRFEPNVANYTYNSSDFCSLEQFDREQIVKCHQWVYDGPESTILREWNITCDENRWKLTMVGTVNNIGQFIGLPIAGFISDAIGRKTTLVVSMVLSCLLGLARSWAWSYEVFLFLEFLEPALGTGVYTSAFILGMELVGPRARVLAATFISSSYALGEALMGAIAWWLQDWRLILRTAYLPAFLCISYYWIVPESVRWLLTKGKNIQAGEIILAAAKTNGVTLSEDVLCRIKSFSQPPEGENAEDSRKPRQGTLLQVFKSKILLVRVIISAFSWVSIVFVYFGLTINSVLVGGNKYTNFILVSLIEFPAYVVTYYAMDRFGRKASLCASLVLSGATCTSFAFVPKDMDWVRLLLFLGGKFAITIAYTVVYVFTAEIFPTELRHSLLGMCATFSQIGSIVSPQTPLLEAYMESLPLLLFGIMSVVSGFLALFFPETLNMKLPDTIEEAQNIGIKETSTSAETTST